MNTEELFLYHAAKYPKMTPQDAVKLCYQSSFGGGHLITDSAKVISRLKAEYAGQPHIHSPLSIEPISPSEDSEVRQSRYCRVYLDGVLSDVMLDTLGRIFILSANQKANGNAVFQSSLSTLKRMAEKKELPFGQTEWEAYLSAYEKAGCPAVSHSNCYRTAYLPSYRVIDTLWTRLLPLAFDIGEYLSTHDRMTVAIDGRAASGKSTAAAMLAELFDGAVIHMDDFFLPPAMRTPERLSEAGGNLHRERFTEEVLPYLTAYRDGSHNSFGYRVFDCQNGGYAPIPRHIPYKRLLICEGAYALHPAFGHYYDLAVFSDISPELQKKRILLRNGEAMLKRFTDRWIPMEEQYISAYSVSLYKNF